MFLLTAEFGINCHIQSRIYFVSLKNVLKQTWKFFMPILTLVLQSKKQL